ncbi:MAG: HIT family protein [Bacteroidia bacterium]|nr:HIT family protein [Bacteroidia bacterium]
MAHTETIFSKIIKGEIPCYKIAEDDKHLAFLDIMPVTKGHVLVIPKEPIDYYFDLSESQMNSLHAFAKKIALAVKKVIPCKKVGLSIVGLEVPHVHIHLIPMNAVSDMNFSNPRPQFTKEEFEEVANLIRSNI